MSISKYESLKKLISGMSRSEKRHFSLYISRLESNKGVKYLELFELMENSPKLSEKEVYKKLNISSSQQMSNLKRHLFYQILRSLRLIYSQAHSSLQLKEYHDYAYILKSKSLYVESLHYINKCHTVLDNNNMAMEVQLLTDRINLNSHIHQYSSEKDSSREKHLYSLFSSIERIKNAQILNIAIEKIKDEFAFYSYSKQSRENYLKRSLLNSQLAAMDPNGLSDHEQFLYLLIWAMHYHYCMQNTIAYRYLLKAEYMLSTMRPEIHFEKIHDYYQIGLSICFHYKDKKRHDYWLASYQDRIENINKQNDRHQILFHFKYFKLAQLDKLILNHDYTNSDELISEIDKYRSKYMDYIPITLLDHLDYKLACIMAYKGDYDASLDNLQRIINKQARSPRNKELQVYSRLLHLNCHYRLNNFQYVDNNITRLRNEFVSQNAFNKIIDINLAFLRKGVKAMNFGLRDFINDIILRLNNIESQDFDQVSSHYFDFIPWLKSIRANVSVEETLKATHKT